jgi:ribosomal protein S6
MEINQENTSEAKVYDLGFHLVPTIAEDAVEADFEAIKAIITKAGGEFISEGKPELITLTYSMSKVVKAIKSNYSKAYFAWVKFTIAPEIVDSIKTSLDASDTVLRYLIVSSVKESTLYADKRADRPQTSEGEEVVEEELATN